MLSTNSSVSRRKRLAQLVVEVREVAGRRDVALAGCGASATGRRSCPRAPATAGRAACAVTSRSSTSGWLSWPRAAAFSSSSSGTELQRKNDSRDASSTSDTRPDRLRGGHRRLGPEQELRVGEDEPQAVLDALLERALRAARGVLLEDGRQVVGGDRPAIGAPSQRPRGWCARMPLRRRPGRPAREDALAAGRRARAR